MRQVLEIAFARAGLDPYKYLDEAESLYRPAEVQVLQGNATKARDKFGWTSRISFEELIEEMVDSDLQLFAK